MFRNKKILAAAILLVILICNYAGKFLVIDESPVKSDVIIILSGGEIDRVEKGVELFERGYADTIIISNAREDGLYEAAVEMGVPPERFLLEMNANSTTENAVYSIELMEKHQFDSAIVVSSNYHMRRVKHNFERAADEQDLTLTFIAGDSPTYQPSTWWASLSGIKVTVNEYAKIIGNSMGFHGDTAKKVLGIFF